ncbi:hypothetical protein AB0399_21090 [Streptomyces sp. NPDC088194]|uniref:hypothetical protein n=1 Tax=Streptomyces sp. NPDC088194 TaxID=3154931 RepID=UPI00344BA818
MSDDGRAAGVPRPRRPERPPGAGGMGDSCCPDASDGWGGPDGSDGWGVPDGSDHSHGWRDFGGPDVLAGFGGAGFGGGPGRPEASGGRADWLTGDAAEALLSGRRVPLADRRAAGEAERLALLLLAAAADPGVLHPLDPGREEAALAAFRAARAAGLGSAEPVLDGVPPVPIAGGPVPGGPAAGDALPEPVVVGGRAADQVRAGSVRSARLVPVRRTRSGRSTRIVLAAAASVVALGGVAVGVAATAARGGGREPVRPAGSSAPVSVASDGSGPPDTGVSGATGRRAVIPGEVPDPARTTPGPPARTALPPDADRDTLVPPGHGDHGRGKGAANRLKHGRHKGWGRGHAVASGAAR